MTWRGRFAILLAASLSLRACEDGHTERHLPSRPQPLFALEGGQRDTVLLRPVFLRTAPGRIYVFDAGRSAVEAFAPGGDLLWVVGRPGAGPGEFRAVVSMDVAADGTLWLMDRALARLTALDADGRIVQSVPLEPGLMDGYRIFARSATRVGLIRQENPVLTVIDAPEGRIQSRHPHPWSTYNDVHPIAADSRFLEDPRSGAIVVVLSYGRGFLVTDAVQGRSSGLHPYVEEAPLPEVRVEHSGNREISSVTAPPATRGAAVHGGILYVAFNGATAAAGRLVDRYHLPDGTYLDSWVLPRRLHGIAVLGDTVYTLEMDSLPALAAYRLTPMP